MTFDRRGIVIVMIPAGSFLLDDPQDVLDCQFPHKKLFQIVGGIVMAASMPSSISRAVGRRINSIAT